MPMAEVYYPTDRVWCSPILPILLRSPRGRAAFVFPNKLWDNMTNIVRQQEFVTVVEAEMMTSFTAPFPRSSGNTRKSIVARQAG
jgi:hypothetical protein